jgi:hypothetical protein
MLQKRPSQISSLFVEGLPNLHCASKCQIYLFKIIKLLIYLPREPAGDGSQEAVVVFETDSAAKTALLLTNALIVDRPITVVPHITSTADTEGGEVTQKEIPQDNITNRSFTAPDHERVCSMSFVSLIIFTQLIEQNISGCFHGCSWICLGHRRGCEST